MDWVLMECFAWSQRALYVSMFLRYKLMKLGHLFRPMKRPQLCRDGGFGPSCRTPDVPRQQGKAGNHVWTATHTVQAAQNFPQRMSPNGVVFATLFEL